MLAIDESQDPECLGGSRTPTARIRANIGGRELSFETCEGLLITKSSISAGTLRRAVVILTRTVTSPSKTKEIEGH